MVFNPLLGKDIDSNQKPPEQSADLAHILSNKFDSLSKKPISAETPKDSKSWAVSNVFNPLWNTAADAYNTVVYNTLGKATNYFCEKAGHKELFAKAALASTEPAAFLSKEYFAQNLVSGIAGAFVYSAAGKVASKILRSGSSAFQVESNLSKVIEADKAAAVYRSITCDKTSQILGAVVFDGMRDVNPGESRLGNMAGSLTAFSIFEHFNPKVSGLPLLSRAYKQAFIGAGGATAQHLVASTVSGHSCSLEEIKQAAESGAFMNTVLPSVQHGLSVGIGRLNDAAGRSNPLERDMKINGIAGQSKTHDELAEKVASLRVKTNQKHTMIENGEVSVQGKGKLADRAHELAHEWYRKTHTKQYDEATKHLQDGNEKHAWKMYKELRLASEIYARKIEVTAACETNDSRTVEMHANNIIKQKTPEGLTYQQQWRREFDAAKDEGENPLSSREYSSSESNETAVRSPLKNLVDLFKSDSKITILDLRELITKIKELDLREKMRYLSTLQKSVRRHLEDNINSGGNLFNNSQEVRKIARELGFFNKLQKKCLEPRLKQDIEKCISLKEFAKIAWNGRNYSLLENSDIRTAIERQVGNNIESGGELFNSPKDLTYLTKDLKLSKSFVQEAVKSRIISECEAAKDTIFSIDKLVQLYGIAKEHSILEKLRENESTRAAFQKGIENVELLDSLQRQPFINHIKEMQDNGLYIPSKKYKEALTRNVNEFPKIEFLQNKDEAQIPKHESELDLEVEAEQKPESRVSVENKSLKFSQSELFSSEDLLTGSMDKLRASAWGYIKRAFSELNDAEHQIMLEQVMSKVKRLAKQNKQNKPGAREKHKLFLDRTEAAVEVSDYANVANSKFALAAAKNHVSPLEYNELETRFSLSHYVPLPFPLDKVWKSGEYTGGFVSREDPSAMFEDCYIGNLLDTQPYYGQESPNAGYFVVKDSTGRVIAKSLAWASTNGGLCFEKIKSDLQLLKEVIPEVLFDSRKEEPFVRNIFLQAAKELVKSKQFDVVTTHREGAQILLTDTKVAGMEKLTYPELIHKNSDKQMILAQKPNQKQKPMRQRHDAKALRAYNECVGTQKTQFNIALKSAREKRNKSLKQGWEAAEASMSTDNDAITASVAYAEAERQAWVEFYSTLGSEADKLAVVMKKGFEAYNKYMSDKAAQDKRKNSD